MKIISSIGPIGSGKDTVIKYISDKYKFNIISMGDIVREIAATQGVPATRDNLHRISQDYFQKYGKEYFINKVVEKIQVSNTDKIAVTGLRTPTDVMKMRNKFGKQFVLIFVDMSDPKKRFERLRSRNEARDAHAWEDFLAQDKEEEEIFSLSETRKLADYVIFNDGGLEDLYLKTEAIVEKELKKG
jgi:dephospho-CoA kinase